VPRRGGGAVSTLLGAVGALLAALVLAPAAMASFDYTWTAGGPIGATDCSLGLNWSGGRRLPAAPPGH
jgi:hypothetical protein